MKTTKFDNTEELKEKRNELIERFDGNLPTYLEDYFEEAELKSLKKEFFEEKRKEDYYKSYQDLRDGIKKREEDFWEDNDSEIKKKSAGASGHDRVWKEPLLSEDTLNKENRELTQEEINILIKLCKSDLYLFAVRYFSHYLKRPSSTFHKYLYGLLVRETNKDRKIGVKWAIAAPRFNAKSSLVSGIYPIWCICYNKKRFILMLSDTAGQSSDFLSDIKRELEYNVKLAKDFPHACGKGKTWKVDEIITSNDVKLLALGTGNKVRGRKFGIYRPDLVIGDDLENSEMVRSETQRYFVRNDWFDKEVLFAGGETDSPTDFFIVGTTIGKDSLLNALLDPTQYPAWGQKRFQAVVSFSHSGLWDEWEAIYKNRFDEERRENALKFFEENEKEMLDGTKVLWPEGDPYYSLMIYKITNPSGFLTEKQNSAVDTTKIYVTEEQLHFEDFKSPEIAEAIKRASRYVFGSLDPSLGKKSKKGDYSAIVTLARDPKTGYIFVLDISLRRRSVDEQIDDILKKHYKYKYKLFGVETNAFQYVVADTLRKRARKESIYVPVEEINQYQDKKMRFEGVVPFLLDGTIVFDKQKWKDNQQYSLGIDQICTFTGEGDEHDDCPNSLEMSFNLAKANRFKMITKGEGGKRIKWQR